MDKNQIFLIAIFPSPIIHLSCHHKFGLFAMLSLISVWLSSGFGLQLFYLFRLLVFLLTQYQKCLVYFLFDRTHSSGSYTIIFSNLISRSNLQPLFNDLLFYRFWDFCFQYDSNNLKITTLRFCMIDLFDNSY